MQLEDVTSVRCEAAPFVRGGYVKASDGNVVVASGLEGVAPIGTTCRIAVGKDADAPTGGLLAEVVSFAREGVTLLPYASPRGVCYGDRVRIDPGTAGLRPTLAWRGRVIDALGEPVDGKGALPQGLDLYPLQGEPVAAMQRNGLGPRLPLGVRALDLFVPCCEAQRIGIFAGSGVGKSSLLSQITRGTKADVLVIGLIGERGRELRDFLEHTLGEDGRARSVVVIATSDQPAMMRKRAAQVTLTVAEQLRDQGLRVLCLLDSVTRYAMALREIYLAAGEVPTSRGYPPSVFAELPRLLERAGPGESGQGSITGLFTVLVEGDDTNEPISDAVRGILDGHVILDRGIAEGGRFPAVDVSRSLSRSTPGCYTPEEAGLVREARGLMRAYGEMAELIQLGAYKTGTNPTLDRAIALRPAFEQLLRQEIGETALSADGFAELARILGRTLPAARAEAR
jgi:flagellum-specific ATP synthase